MTSIVRPESGICFSFVSGESTFRGPLFEHDSATAKLDLALYPAGTAQGLRSTQAGILFPPAEANGSILHVKPDGLPTADCLSWGAACDLQTALAAATSGDELWVAEGTYTPGPAGDRNVTFQLKDGVRIYGGFAGDEAALSGRDWAAHPTILSGDLSANDDLFEPTSYAENSLHVLSGDGVDAAALLEGFTVISGNADVDNFSSGWGGGMYLKDSQLIIQNVILDDNKAWGGGGMFIDGGGPRLNNVVF